MVCINASFLIRSGLSVSQHLWCNFTDGITVVCKYRSLTSYLTPNYNSSSTNLIAHRADLVWILVRMIDEERRKLLQTWKQK